MICPECKNEIADGARFCSNCGCDVELAKQAYSEGDNCDTLIVHGGKSQSLDGKFVIFDTETTGLDSEYDRLTQIAGLVFSDGRIYSSFDTMVDPERPIPEKITELTGIDDAMVEGAPSEAEALRRFLEFANGAVLVAHNANFHVGFLKAAAKRSNIEFNCTFIDTLSLARVLYQDLSGFSLNELAAHFGIGDCSNPSKALSDALKVHGIFALMIDDLKNKYNINDISEINSKLVGESAFDSFAPQPKKSGNWTGTEKVALAIPIIVVSFLLIAMIDSALFPTHYSPSSNSSFSKSSSSSRSSSSYSSTICAQPGCTKSRATGSIYCIDHEKGQTSSSSSSSSSFRYPSASDLQISNVSVQTNSAATYCTGTIKNNGKLAFEFVRVKGSFKDGAGNVIETGSSYAVGSEGLSPGESTSFRIQCARNPKVKSCDVEVYDFR